MSDIDRLTLQRKVPPGAQPDAVDSLAAHGPFEERAQGRDDQGGGVTEARRQAKRRLRRAKTVLHPGDLIECYYDRELLQHACPGARLVSDLGRATASGSSRRAC